MTTTESEPVRAARPTQRDANRAARRGGGFGPLWNAFKNIAIVFSFIVNFILVLVLLLAPEPVFMVKSQVAEPLLLDLDSAFAALGETHIRSTVYITDTMPVVFDLPLAQDTNVVLVEAVPLQAPATFVLPGGGGAIHGTVQLALPKGMALPVALNLMVPVSTTVPVVMQVPVEIPLAEAGMAPAIEQLRAVFSPLTVAVQSLPDSTEEVLQQVVSKNP
ncbi:MAG: hypothetical protein WHX52_06650 [Anaerolineae bacterium]